MSPVRVFKIRTANQILYIKCVTDRRALHDVVNSSITLTEKRLKIELFVMRESLEKEGSYSVAWVNSNDQLPDCLTKEGGSPEKLCDILSEIVILSCNKKRESIWKQSILKKIKTIAKK